MDAVPYTIHDHLKFEYEGKIHTIIGDLEPYALCNLVDFNMEGLDLHYPEFQIVILEVESRLIKAKKMVKVHA